MENTGSPSCSPGGGKSSPACSGNPVGGTISGRIRAGFCGNDGANRCRAIDEKRSGDPPVRGNAAPTHTPGTHPAGHQQLSVPLSLRLVDGTGRILRNHSGNTVPPAGPPPGDNGPAGTARPEDEGVFINDDKEIREHEIVAGSILSRPVPLRQRHQNGTQRAEPGHPDPLRHLPHTGIGRTAYSGPLDTAAPPHPRPWVPSPARKTRSPSWTTGVHVSAVRFTSAPRSGFWKMETFSAW